MNIVRTIGVIIGLLAGIIYLVFAYAMIGWGWSDGGNRWSVAHWAVTVGICSIPFLLTFRFVYRCFCTEEMEYRDILAWSVRPLALKRALLAELATLAVAPVLIYLWLQLQFARERSSRVLLEPQPPLVEIHDSGERPRLPLAHEAVGIAAADGKFMPAMLLIWPPPAAGFENLSFDLSAGPPRFRVYRGTNEMATNNHFLGEFQVGGFSKSKKSLSVLVLFEVSETRQLYVQARADKSSMSLQRLEPTAKE